MFKQSLVHIFDQLMKSLQGCEEYQAIVSDIYTAFKHSSSAARDGFTNSQFNADYLVELRSLMTGVCGENFPLKALEDILARSDTVPPRGALFDKAVFPRVRIEERVGMNSSGISTSNWKESIRLSVNVAKRYQQVLNHYQNNQN